MSVLDTKQVKCGDCEGTGVCHRCGGAGLVDHVCIALSLDTIHMVYSWSKSRMGIRTSSESLGYYICRECNRLWMIRYQYDVGTGRDNVWVRAGQESKYDKFEESTAYHLRAIMGAESPGELSEALVVDEDWLRGLASRKLEKFRLEQLEAERV